jgi:TPR repeat protein
VDKDEVKAHELMVGAAVSWAVDIKIIFALDSLRSQRRRRPITLHTTPPHRKAKEPKHSEAIFNAGVYYAKGIGCKRNESKALDFYREAADLGHSEGEFLVGTEFVRRYYRYGQVGKYIA